MGLTTGHVFSDGDTVTAAKLNSMVNDATISSDTITSAMIQDDAIDSRHIADGAITSNHITSGSVALDSIASGQTTAGYLIQSDGSGDLTTLNVGATGTVLVSNGAETAPSFTTVGGAGINASMISDHDKLESPAITDQLLAKSITAGVNKRLEIQDLYRTVSGLTAITDADVVSADEHLIIDGGVPKKITQGNLESSVLKSINGLSSLDDTTVADDDVMLVYDTSASAVKKIAKSNLGTGGSIKEIQTLITVASNGVNMTDTITAAPSSNDSGVLVVYTLSSGSAGHQGNLTVTLPDAANYVSEGVKDLTLIINYPPLPFGAGELIVNSTDSDGNAVYGGPTGDVRQGTFVRCVPYVSGSSHFWTVSNQL